MCCQKAFTASDMEPALGLDPGGLLANGNRVANIARARELLGVLSPTASTATEPAGDGAQDADDKHANPCPCCGGPMIVIEVFEPGCKPKHQPITRGIDSS